MKSAEEVESGSGNQQASWETLNQGPSNILEAIPGWAWMAMGGIFLIFLANIAARTALPLKASQRTLLTLGEISLGFIIAAISHGLAYLFAAYKSDKFGPFDFFMKPVEIWKPTFAKLPEGNRRICGAIWGMAMMFAAVVILGGFAFDAMFEDWGFEKRETNLVKEVVKRARKKGKGDGDLEGAMKEFVGEGELEDEPAPLLETQCVILGYTISETGELESLILGSVPRGGLSYVGVVLKKDIPEEKRAEVLMEVQNANSLEECCIKRGVPIEKAHWLEPKVRCLIEHKAWTTQYRLQQPVFLELVIQEETEEP